MTNLQMIGWFAVLVFVLVGACLCWPTEPAVGTATAGAHHPATERVVLAAEPVERILGVEARVLLFVCGALLMMAAGAALSYVHIHRRYAQSGPSR